MPSLSLLLPLLSAAWAAPPARCAAAPDPDAPLRRIAPADIPAVVAEHRGCVLLLEVYASWCGTCTRTAPAITALVEGLRPAGLAAVGLSVDTSAERLLSWRAAHGREYAPIQVEGWTLEALRVNLAAVGVTFEEAIPLLVLFDAEGRAVLQLTEPRTLAPLEAAARQLLSGG